MRMEVEVQQGMHARVDDEHDVAAMATVPAIRTAERLELLPVDRGSTVPAVAGDRMHNHAVDERRHGTCSFHAKGGPTPGPAFRNRSVLSAPPARPGGSRPSAR